MVFGQTQVEDKSCCVIVNIMQASLDCERTDDRSTGERTYKISGDIVNTAKKHCITGPTLFPAGNSLSHRGAVVDCQSGEYPKPQKANEVKPLVQFNCVGTNKKLDMFSAKWRRCAKPCSSDISEIEDCPGYTPPEVVPGWEFTGDPRPKCCCEKETKIPIDFEVKFTAAVRDITDVFGGTVETVGRIITDSEGEDLFDELIPLLEGKLGREVGCACKEIGRPRSLGRPDLEKNDPDIGDLLPDVFPPLKEITSLVGTITSTATDITNWLTDGQGGASEEKKEAGKKPTIPPLNHTPCP
jgi:hypothetical protein